MKRINKDKSSSGPVDRGGYISDRQPLQKDNFLQNFEGVSDKFALTLLSRIKAIYEINGPGNLSHQRRFDIESLKNRLKDRVGTLNQQGNIFEAEKVRFALDNLIAECEEVRTHSTR